MAALATRRVRRVQPSPGEALAIDWSNPITRDLVLAVSNADAGYGFSVNGNNVFPLTGGAQRNTPQGTGAFSSGTNTIFTVAGGHGLTSTNYSLFAFGTCTSASGTQNALDMDNASPRYFQFRINAGKVEFIPFNTSAGTTGVCTASTALSLSEMSRGFTMGATASPTRTACFQNGVLAATATPSNLIAPAQNMGLGVGARVTGTAGWWNTGALMLVLAWNRTLSDAEMQSLADNPWQIFKPPVRRMWMPRAASAAYVLQAAVGAFAWSAGQAALVAARRLVAAAGSLASGWNPANLRVSRRLPGDAGIFTMTGAAASIAAARKIAAGVGAFGLAGTAPSLTVARRLPAQTAMFTLSPGSMQMVYTPVQGPSGPTYTLTATVGAFALIAAAAGVLARRRLATTSASFAWSGAAAALLAGRRVPANAEAFVLAGADAQLRYSAQASYARAPAGAGYVPQQHYNEARPAATNAARPTEAGQARPAATQRNIR